MSRFWYSKEIIILATQAHQVFYVDNPKNGNNWKVVQVIQNKRIWDVPEVEDVKNEHINILEVVVSHQVDDHIEDDTLCKIDVDPTIVERSVVRHVTDTSSTMWMNTCIMSSSYPCHNFLEIDTMFLEFQDELDNLTGGSSWWVTISSSQQPMTPTPRRYVQSQLLELERHIAVHGRIPMTIASEVGREYIEVVKDDLQRFFVLNFNDQAMNRFVEHQILTTFKEFWVDCHRHFKKYSEPEEARGNPPNILKQSRTNKTARQKQPYNHSSRSKSFLQRQHELAEKKGKPVDRVELFQETHVRVETFVSRAAEDTHNQMLELQSQPIPKGSQLLSGDEI
ncbi:CACTA en-spm transposon protein [Cucumis melo var. makuwa]|uniref:CACTA en-spm transposon protein n=1 Tax=Cucumis melo var. makuwa TaxID=1194695 RepID=A0A5A7TE89_CUCMM|nr:CACTA en-spm transposon protein [Cucumis melo var. makuwa]TYK19647.1 CACTA en-spm transposon protein [Cucumis melo var. makuwa]